MAQQTEQIGEVNKTITAVEWLYKLSKQRELDKFDLEQAKQMELEQRKEDFKIGYTQGYLDSQCNHINDADNFASEQEYIMHNKT
jgi:hypothetical protein